MVSPQLAQLACLCWLLMPTYHEGEGGGGTGIAEALGATGADAMGRETCLDGGGVGEVLGRPRLSEGGPVADDSTQASTQGRRDLWDGAVCGESWIGEAGAIKTSVSKSPKAMPDEGASTGNMCSSSSMISTGIGVVAASSNGSVSGKW